jgi:hypothetical protein
MDGKSCELGHVGWVYSDVVRRDATLRSILSGSTHLDRRFDWADAARTIRAYFGAAMFLAPAAATP